MPTTMRQPTRRVFTFSWRWALGFALLAYLLLGLFQLRLPGLYYDEALDAVPAMQVLLGQKPETGAVVRIAGHDWPLMLMPYVGSTTTYLSTIAFALFGPNVIALRLMNWTLGLVSLLLAWGFLRDYLDERVAGLATVLLAVNPNFVFWTRMGAFVSLPMLPLAIGALWSLYRWYRRRGDHYLVVACFLLGLGITTKLLFFWYWVGLALGWLVLSPFLKRGQGWRAWLWPWSSTTWKVRLFSLLALLLGLAPLLMYNFQTLETLRFVVETFARETTRTGGLLTNIPAVVQRDFGRFLDGSWFGMRLGPVQTNRLAVPVFFASCAALVGLGLAGKLFFSGRKLVLLAILLVSIAAQSALTTMGQGADHLVILWPIPQTLIATAVFALADLTWRRRWPAVFVGLLAISMLASEALTTVLYHRSLAQSGGQGFFSDTIYTLANDLEQADSPKIVALDWGFARNLQLLTGGQLKIEEWFTYASSPGEEAEAYLEHLVDQPDLLYLLHVPRFTAFPGHRELFDKVAYRNDLTPALWKSYPQRNGESVVEVYSLDPTPPLVQLPATARPLEATVGDSLQLLGYSLSAPIIAPGDTLQATLYWQATSQQDRSYKVFVHLVDDTGRLWSQHDAIPRAWGYPTTAWQPNEIVADRIWLPVPADAPSGRYYLRAGMYEETTGERLPIARAGQSQGEDALQLAEIEIKP